MRFDCVLTRGEAHRQEKAQVLPQDELDEWNHPPIFAYQIASFVLAHTRDTK